MDGPDDGTGRHVRFRGVWPQGRGSSNLPLGTMEQSTTPPPSFPKGKGRKAPRYRDNRNNGPKKRVLQTLKRPERDVHEDHMQQDSLKVTHLGGLGEIGRNMQVFEYKEAIIIVQAGFGCT